MGEKSEVMTYITVLIICCKNCKHALFCGMNQMWKDMMLPHSIIVLAILLFKLCSFEVPIGPHYLCGLSFFQLLTGLIVPLPHLWMALQWFSHFPITFIDFIDLINILQFQFAVDTTFPLTWPANADISMCPSPVGNLVLLRLKCAWESPGELF